MATHEVLFQPYQKLLEEARERPFDEDEWRQRLREAQCAMQGRQLSRRTTRSGVEYGSRTEALIPSFRNEPKLEERVRRAAPKDQLIMLRQYNVWLEHGVTINAPRPWLEGVVYDDDCAVVPPPEQDVQFLEESILLEAWKPGVLQPARLRPVKLEDGTISLAIPREIIVHAEPHIVKMEPGSFEDTRAECVSVMANKDGNNLMEDSRNLIHDHSASSNVQNYGEERHRLGLTDSQMEAANVSQVEAMGGKNNLDGAAVQTVSPPEAGSVSWDRLAEAGSSLPAGLDSDAMLREEIGQLDNVVQMAVSLEKPRKRRRLIKKRSTTQSSLSSDLLDNHINKNEMSNGTINKINDKNDVSKEVHSIPVIYLSDSEGTPTGQIPIINLSDSDEDVVASPSSGFRRWRSSAAGDLRSVLEVHPRPANGKARKSMETTDGKQEAEKSQKQKRGRESTRVVSLQKVGKSLESTDGKQQAVKTLVSRPKPFVSFHDFTAGEDGTPPSSPSPVVMEDEKEVLAEYKEPGTPVVPPPNMAPGKKAGQGLHVGAMRPQRATRVAMVPQPVRGSPSGAMASMEHNQARGVARAPQHMSAFHDSTLDQAREIHRANNADVRNSTSHYQNHSTSRSPSFNMTPGTGTHPHLSSHIPLPFAELGEKERRVVRNKRFWRSQIIGEHLNGRPASYACPECPVIIVGVKNVKRHYQVTHGHGEKQLSATGAAIVPKRVYQNLSGPIASMALNLPLEAARTPQHIPAIDDSRTSEIQQTSNADIGNSISFSQNPSATRALSFNMTTGTSTHPHLSSGVPLPLGKLGDKERSVVRSKKYWMNQVVGKDSKGQVCFACPDCGEVVMGFLNVRNHYVVTHGQGQEQRGATGAAVVPQPVHQDPPGAMASMALNMPCGASRAPQHTPSVLDSGAREIQQTSYADIGNSISFSQNPSASRSPSLNMTTGTSTHPHRSSGVPRPLANLGGKEESVTRGYYKCVGLNRSGQYCYACGDCGEIIVGANNIRHHNKVTHGQGEGQRSALAPYAALAKLRGEGKSALTGEKYYQFTGQNGLGQNCFACPYCGEIVMGRKNIRHHYAAAHGSGEEQPTVPAARRKASRKKKGVVSKSLKERDIECADCPKKFAEEADLKQHRRDKHGL